VDIFNKFIEIYNRLVTLLEQRAEKRK